jgi:plastocyanin
MEARIRRWGLTVTVLVATLALATGTASADEVTHDQEIDIRGIAYEHDVAAVTLGEEVTWTNSDAVDHTVTSDDCIGGPCTFDSGTMASGDAFTWTPIEPGTVEYYCQFHGSMDAELRVQTADLNDANPHITDDDVTVDNPPLVDTAPQVPNPYTYEIEALVHNTGHANADDLDVHIEYEAPSGDQGTITQRTVTVDGDDDVLVEATWDASGRVLETGQYTIKVTLDEDNGIVEAYEDDNYAETTFTVGPLGLAS